MKGHEMEFVRNNNLIDEIVCVDGIGCSGKGMMSNVISCYERVEKQNIQPLFEDIPRMYSLGKLEKDAAIALLRTIGDTIMYNTEIGRDVNFRNTDGTGVKKAGNYRRYYRRLKMPDGDAAVKRIRDNHSILSILTHDGIRHNEILFEAFPKLKLIYMIRNPIDLVYTWHFGDTKAFQGNRRGHFGERIGIDPRDFQYTFKYKETVLPYSCLGYEEEYISATPLERVILLISLHFKLNIEKYGTLSSDIRSKILLIDFDAFVKEPYPFCDMLESFLQTKRTADLKRILKRERCPRVVEDDYAEKKDYLKHNVSDHYMRVLDDVIQQHGEILRK